VKKVSNKISDLSFLFVNVFNGLAFSTRTRHFSEKSPARDRKKPIPEKTGTPEKTDQYRSARVAP